MKRVFAAIDISSDARRSIQIYADELRAVFRELSVRWERAEKYHITLKFAGLLDDDQQITFTDQVRAAAASTEPFLMRIAGTGVFVNHRAPSVLWLGTELIENVIDPIATMAAQLNEIPIRPFDPHLTIARLKDAKASRGLIDVHRKAKFKSEDFEVTKLVIFESTLMPFGSVYSKLVSFALGEKSSI